MKLSINVPDQHKGRLAKAFGTNMKIEEIAVKALLKLLGEVELQQFAVAKRAEVEAEAKRINEELELTGGR